MCNKKKNYIKPTAAEFQAFMKLSIGVVKGLTFNGRLFVDFMKWVAHV